MANFKRKRRKSQRVCGLCKPHKRAGWCVHYRAMLHGDKRRYSSARDQLVCEGVKVESRE